MLFTACTSSSIVDHPSLRSKDALAFDICQADVRDVYNERKLVYDTINDYFKIIIAEEQLKEVCRTDGDRCHLEPMKAKVILPKGGEIDPDDLHIQIEPSSNRNFVLNVDRVRGRAPYAKINLTERPPIRTAQTIMKIEYE